MSSSFGDFQIRMIQDDEYELLRDFGYVDEVQGLILVPKGFKTNFASIEGLRVALFPIYAALANYGDRAATIHDYLYSGYPIVKADGSEFFPTRKEADDVFYRALRAEGIARWRAWMFWSGVRIGGEKYYSVNKRHQFKNKGE